MLVTAAQAPLLSQGHANRSEDREEGTEEGKQHIFEQLIDAGADLLGCAGVEVLQAQHQAEEGADNPDPRQDARQVLVKLGPQRRLHHRLRGEEMSRARRGTGAQHALLTLAHLELIMQRLGILLPGMPQRMLLEQLLQLATALGRLQLLDCPHLPRELLQAPTQCK
ncbi:Uncharacterised protein [Acinetobacter baumannii]|nr:Uncharacterised protein [Acinetobacter baumannii]